MLRYDLRSSHILNMNKVYKLIPLFIRERISPFLSSLNLPVHYFSSDEKAGDQTVIACLSVNADRARLWGKRFLGDNFTYRKGSRAWVWRIKRHVNNEQPGVNLIVVETNAITDFLLKKPKGLKVPMWVQFCLDIDRPLKDLVAPSTRLREQIPRLIRHHDLEYKISNDMNKLAHFIDTMYVPFIQGRHGETAFVSSKEEITRAFKTSDLMFIMKSGEAIAGGLIVYSGNTAFLRYIGVLDNNYDHLKSGGVSAYYYFSLIHAMEKGMSVVNLGGTNPFLADGVAFFKLTFRPYVERISYLGEFPIRMTVQNPTISLLRFLTNNSLLHIDENQKLQQLYLVDNFQDDYESQLSAILKRTRCTNIQNQKFAVRDTSMQSISRLEKFLINNDKEDFSIVSWDSVLPNLTGGSHQHQVGP